MGDFDEHLKHDLECEEMQYAVMVGISGILLAVAGVAPLHVDRSQPLLQGCFTVICAFY